MTNRARFWFFMYPYFLPITKQEKSSLFYTLLPPVIGVDKKNCLLVNGSGFQPKRGSGASESHLSHGGALSYICIKVWWERANILTTN